MTVDESRKLKRGDQLRIIDPGLLHSGQQRSYRDSPVLTFKKFDRRHGPEGDLLLMEGDYMFGLWAHQVQRNEGPW